MSHLNKPHSAPGKITPQLEPLILELAGKGQSTRVISAALKGHGVDISHVCIAAFLKKTRVERSDAAKAVVRERVGRTLTEDLDQLGERLSQAGEFADAAYERKDFTEFAGAVELERKLLEMRIKFSGAAEPDDGSEQMAATAKKVIDRLRALLPQPTSLPE